MTKTRVTRRPAAASKGRDGATGRLRDERGLALVIVLSIVALLTITVIEFTYTVQLDMHRSRNALDAMQAKLLARSGVNLAAAFLAQDQEEKYDAPSEEWAIALDEFCQGVEIAPTALLKCSVEDESGKINVNNTRPKGSQAVDDEGHLNTPEAYLRDGIEALAVRYGIDISELGDRIREYWLTLPPTADNDQNARVPEFGTLEEFAARFRIPTSKLKKLRRVLTALPASQLRTININTAYPEVLEAILVGEGDPGGEPALQSIVTRREEAPIEQGEIDGLITDLEEKHRAAVKKMLATNSRYFRLQASALTNVDPTGRSVGGIGQTLSVLVSRSKRLVQGGGQEQQFSWTFRLLDWQKEAGARLFRQQPGEDLDDTDESDVAEDELLEP